jgi:apolipoprotein D and lipocalin family protein
MPTMKNRTGESLASFGMPMKTQYLLSIRGCAVVMSFVAITTLLYSGCAAKLPRLNTVKSVNIERFMGDWYVIANIPTWIEKGAHNAVESYRLDKDGTIATTFIFRKGAFDGPLKTYKPRGFILDKTSNAEWEMQFIWPFKSEYLITYLNENYTHTIIARNKRDYVWIMARTPTIPVADYTELVAKLVAQGYNTSLLRKVPQRWLDKNR